MSHNIEEQKDVAVQEASTTTGVEPASQVSTKRTYQHTDDYKKLKLIQAVDFGLNISAASRLVEMSVPTAHLLMRKFEP